MNGLQAIFSREPDAHKKTEKQKKRSSAQNTVGHR